jgi:hypothetical protein
MARPDHFGDAAGRWNLINKELYKQLGLSIPKDALDKIREIRNSRRHKQGNTEVKREAKILIAIRDGIDWRMGEMMEIMFIQPRSEGGLEVASNVRLSGSRVWQGAR